MKRITWWLLIFLLWTVKVAETQDPNPQTSFSTTLLYAQPSLYLNFNDPTTSFLDQISGLSFSGGPVTVNTVIGTIPGSYTGSQTLGWSNVLRGTPNTLTAGNITAINVCYFTTPSAGQSLTVYTTTTPSTGTIQTVTTMTVAAVSGCQTLTAPTNFTAIPTTAGEGVGFYAASGIEPAVNTSLGSYGQNTTAPIVGGSTPGTGRTGEFGFTVTVSTVYTSGTVTPRQPGFDNTQINNTSAEFPYNGFNVAPNNTLGAIDWNTPWTMLVHIDRLNWNRTGTLVLASKGDVSVSSNQHWELYLQMSGLHSQLCFAAGGGTSQGGVCTTGASFDAMPNGFNYNIIVTNSGTGSTGFVGGYPNALTMYINGLDATYIPQTNLVTNGTGFGNVTVTFGGSGTGYANVTQFTSSGGGTNCVVAGQMNASGGVPTTISYTTGSPNFGCTSAPTISLTAPTGTGVTLTATPTGNSMNSTTLPLLAPGYVSAGTYNGLAGTTSAQTPTYIDEFAVFPSALSQTSIQGIFYQTKFYQALMNTLPANPTAFIFDDDACGDFDNFVAFQHAISDRRLGFLNIVGSVQESADGVGAAIFRQMLNQAGLADVQVGIPTGGWSAGGTGGGCAAANVTTYNASTSQNAATYPAAATVYRQAFANVWANNPSAPIDIITGGPLFGLAQFMQSPADSISSLTGLQMLAQDATNGGVVYMQGGYCTPSAPPATTPCTGELGIQGLSDTGGGAAAQYVVTNNGSMPLIAVGGTPGDSGPGPLYTRTSKDPLYLASVTAGTDVRVAYDSLALTPLVSSLFTGGAIVGYSGGTGYANSTYFNFSGGGANCQGSGIMTASGGVPNGITTIWGQNQTGITFEGLGSGCLSAPTVNLVSPTGLGVTLTAYPTFVCGTDTIAGSGTTWTDTFTSTTCSNQYIEPMSLPAASGGGGSYPYFIPFLNSLIDPPPNGAPKVQ